jgi:hypothetical protein
LGDEEYHCHCHRHRRRHRPIEEWEGVRFGVEEEEMAQIAGR